MVNFTLKSLYSIYIYIKDDLFLIAIFSQSTITYYISIYYQIIIIHYYYTLLIWIILFNISNLCDIILTYIFTNK
jgi:hypothetical protein